MRSKFEGRIYSMTIAKDKKAEYEPIRIPFEPKTRHYVPDIRMSNGIYIEVKGRFTSSDRAKHLRIKEQHPELDIRFVFMRPTQKLTKVSKTSYAEWADKHGYKHTDEKNFEKVLDKWTKETI